MRKPRKRTYNRTQKRKWLIKTRYGLTVEQVDLLVEEQRGLCAICEGPMSRVCIDHNHTTGTPRGLLCHRCNIRLNPIEDVEFKAKAEAYLRRYTK